MLLLLQSTAISVTFWVWFYSIRQANHFYQKMALQNDFQPNSNPKRQKVAPTMLIPSNESNLILKGDTPTPDRADRTSFSSIKESNSGIAQSFTTSKTSSYLRNQYSTDNIDDEDAIIDESSSGARTPKAELTHTSGMLTNPHSLLQPLLCPCESFKGWKGITLSGRIASKSFGDLKALGSRWEWTSPRAKADSPDVDVEEAQEVTLIDGNFPAGKSPLELLPMELLSKFDVSMQTIMRDNEGASAKRPSHGNSIVRPLPNSC